MRPTRIRDIVMLHIQNFLVRNVCKIMMVFAFIVVSCSVTFAESVVYIFAIQSWSPIPIMVNNQEVFKMEGNSIGKGLTARYSACKKKCIFKSEGKIIFSVDFKMSTPAYPNNVLRFATEIQLNLSENSVHYIRLSSKGINDMQFKEITEKEAQQLLKKKSYILLPDYIEK